MAERIVNEGLSVRQTENIVTRMLKSQEEPLKEENTGDEIQVNYIEEAERKLTSALGRKVNIKDKGKKGKIELCYYGSDDREEIIKCLMSLSKSSGGDI